MAILIRDNLNDKRSASLALKIDGQELFAFDGEKEVKLPISLYQLLAIESGAEDMLRDDVNELYVQHFLADEDGDFEAELWIMMGDEVELYVSRDEIMASPRSCKCSCGCGNKAVPFSFYCMDCTLGEQSHSYQIEVLGVNPPWDL